MKQYVAVTNDKFELPLCSEDTAAELGKHFNLSKKQTFETISRAKKRNVRTYYKLICIDIGDPYKTERGDFSGINLGQN